MRPTSRELAEMHALAFHQRRKRPRACWYDGRPKRSFRTKRAANRARLKYQRAYRCPQHGWHLTSQPKPKARLADTASLR